ncbi:Hypothetical protein NCS54_00579300 [Fusarium falciforme]|uniref:Hypothetical protein n=1 Tax=Fusarium falciforme TaxID=195108 RepID=UPI0023013881|nr:Hypothetical protein NCS54_00579300 [Fusarium falciforme]WAO88445.1 Hypothetical protein NCS54_00579300 [Fusarium falciforme]
MTTEAEVRPLDDVQPHADTNTDAPAHDRQNTPEKEPLKRRASNDEEEGSAKRIRRDDHFREATDERPRRGSSQSRRESHGSSAAIDADRRRLATQEEKKRGKRLFGGLLSTLSQTTGSSQQKRRLEIERRQQERLQKQKLEDDRARDENRARLTGIRMAEQIVFDEQVMRNKHSKMLATARYLRTTAHPRIYYLPWRLTEEQENEIDNQVGQAKATIARQLEAFAARKERHAKDSGRDRRSSSPVTAPVPAPASEASVDKARILFDLSLVISAARSLTHDRAFAMCLAMTMQASGNYNARFSERHLTDVTRPAKSTPGPGLTSLSGSFVRPCLGTLDTTPPYRFWSLAKSEEHWGLCELGFFSLNGPFALTNPHNYTPRNLANTQPTEYPAMAPDKLAPNDPRVKAETAEIRGKTYKYIVGEPENTPVATLVLVHGFPDLGFGWRYQVPYFMSLGFRVVVPDMLGYGGTDAPESLKEYTYKNLAADIKELAQKIVGDGQIILGGHDWGGALVWRIAMWHPELIKGVFSVCTPYHPPSETFIPLDKIIASGHLLNFTYQLQFAGPDVQDRIQGKDKVRQFLNALYGGRGPNGEWGFSTKEGILFDNLPLLERSRLLSEEEHEYYTEQYAARGSPEMRGPLNWYRMRELNHGDEVEIAKAGHKFAMPALFITATEDSALPPAMSLGMDKNFDNLTRGEVKASHWALWQAAEDVNGQIAKWADGVLNGALKASL